MSRKQFSIFIAVGGLITLAAVLCTALVSCQAPSSNATQLEPTGPLSHMFLLRDFRSRRASSWNRAGMNKDNVVVSPGQTEVLLQETGAGCIKHFYWAYIEAKPEKREKLFRGAVLRAFWDGSAKPSIEVPIGDLFGVANGFLRPVKSLAFTTNPGSKGEPVSWGFNCYLPMPFAQGARIELENQSDEDVRVWFHIDYELYDAPGILHNASRLHAHWNRENPTKGIPFPEADDPRDRNNMNNLGQAGNVTGHENYEILNVKASGQFVGYFMTVVNFAADPRSWWGEGDDMIFIDGEDFPPSFHGTGSEEIFGGGACPAVEYTGPYTGFHTVENWIDETDKRKGAANRKWLGTNGLYRFHVNDPIRFRESIRVTIEHGHANNKTNDYSSVAFWYQEGINETLPPLAPIEERGFTTDYREPPAGAAKPGQ